MPNKTRLKDGGPRGRVSPLEALDRLLEESAGGVLRQRTARKRAYRRAQTAVEAAAGNPRAAGVALLGYASEVFVAHAVELAAERGLLRALVARIEASVGIPRTALARDVLAAPQLLQLPSGVAIEVELALTLEFTDAAAVSLWTQSQSDEIGEIAHAGDFDPESAQTQRLAGCLLGDGNEKSERARDVAGVLVERWEQPAAALMVRGKEAASAARRPILESAGPMLTAMLARDELLSRSGAAAPDVKGSAERRLTRLRFDLHDGPQQDVILLAEDIELLRTQLETAMNGQPTKARLLGRFDDLQARLVAIDGDLRRIAAFVQSPFMQEEPMPEALAKLCDEFAARSGIEPDTELKGDFSTLTDSQQITLLGLIREALSNIREHSEAEHVTIRLSAGRGGVEATVIDDGRGFVPETTLVEAARGGHLGLVGMHERVRLLGGRTQIESRPGGPTVISAHLPPFSHADGPKRAR